MSLTLIVIIIIIIIIIIVVLLMPRHATAAAAAAAAPLWTLDMFHFCQSWANLIPACRTVTFISDSLADPFSRLFCDLLFFVSLSVYMVFQCLLSSCNYIRFKVKQIYIAPCVASNSEATRLCSIFWVTSWIHSIFLGISALLILSRPVMPSILCRHVIANIVILV